MIHYLDINMRVSNFGLDRSTLNCYNLIKILFIFFSNDHYYFYNYKQKTVIYNYHYITLHLKKYTLTHIKNNKSNVITDKL